MKGKGHAQDPFRPYIEHLRRHRTRLRIEIAPVVCAFLYSHLLRWDRVLKGLTNDGRRSPEDGVRRLADRVRDKVMMIEQLIAEVVQPINRNDWLDGEAFASECVANYVRLFVPDGPDELPTHDLGGEGG